MANLFSHRCLFHVRLPGRRRSGGTRLTSQPRPAAVNFRLAGFDTSPERAGFWAEDVFAFLERAIHEKRQGTWSSQRPPSFVRRKKDREAGARAHTRLFKKSVQITAPGGLLCAASCSSHVPMTDFKQLVETRHRPSPPGVGSHLPASRLRANHPAKDSFPEGDCLKFLAVRLD